MEEIDESLLRNILKAHSKTAIEALYLELKCLPIRYHNMYRRLNFLHYMLSLENTELLSQFVKRQFENPSKGDWVQLVNEDLEKLNTTPNHDEIKKMKKEDFKLVKLQ